MKADNLHNFNSFALHKFGKYKTINKLSLNYFPLKLWTYHTTHLVWTGKSGVQGSFWGLAQSTVIFAFLHIVRWITKTLRRRSYSQVHEFTIHNSALFKFDEQQRMRTQMECAVSKECYMIQSSCC